MLRTRLARSIVTFKRLEKAEIDAYVANGEGLGKAGGYAIQGRAAGFARAMSGSYSGIVGLPLFETRALLRAAGIAPARVALCGRDRHSVVVGTRGSVRVHLGGPRTNQ